LRIVRFSAEGKTKYGLLKGNSIQGIAGNPITQFKGPKTEFKLDGSSYQLKDVKLLAPCVPTKIVALGINYVAHAAESDKFPIPKVPLIFIKPNTAVIGPDETVILPKDTTRRVDFEGELAVVIAKKCTDVSVEDAKKYVFGYTIMNDVSDRTALREDNMWITRSKGYNTFAPMGPWIETELDNPDNVMLETRLNGETKQKAPTSDMIFNISTQVSFISSVMTLLPGDVISTGTPETPGPMKQGDVCEITVEKIGTLRNVMGIHK
jgi:2-keto-4-pentenoate hydratase/2-oxohepta-3-ene-1,7-dioic acid hydratase in catechol pathway